MRPLGTTAPQRWMSVCRWLLAVLLAGWAVDAQAQTDTQDRKRWTVRYFRMLDAHNEANGQGVVDYLDDNGFGETRSGLFGPISYPLTRNAEGGTGWSLTATYAYRPWLQVGGSFHRAMSMNTSGYRSDSGRINLNHEMWSVGPVVVWKPANNLAMGAGPALIRGTATRVDARFLIGEDARAPQEETFLRVGAVAFASLGFTLFRTVYVGVQGHYLYSGKAEIGPFTVGDQTLEAGNVRLDQFAVGPVVALNL